MCCVAQVRYKLYSKQIFITFALIGQEKQKGSDKSYRLYKYKLYRHHNSLNSRYSSAAITASTTAGSIFATLIFLPHTRFNPTQKIKIDPINER